jgi:manganese/zinc/iron transport system permease protein
VTGAALSATWPRLPAGAVIVLVAAAFFGISMLLGTSRGVLRRWRMHHVLVRRVARQHLLRAIYECLEQAGPGAMMDVPLTRGVAIRDIQARRTWTEAALQRQIRRLMRADLVDGQGETVRLTPAGIEEARRVVRNHRLWELYLITQADVAPSHVDRDADEIEHVLGRAQVAELEQLLAAAGGAAVPRSPHPLVGAP